MPPKSSAHFYKKSEIDRAHLSDVCEETLGVKPFSWQMDAGCEILSGGDVILDAGCGCGKSVVFQLPLLLDETSIGLVMLPLSALMLEQAQNSKLRTVAVCSETIEEVGRDELYRRIASGSYQLVLVSPEIAISPDFSQHVLSKREFNSRLRMVCIDEAHCINIWGGGGFRPDYAALSWVWDPAMDPRVQIVSSGAAGAALVQLRAYFHRCKGASSGIGSFTGAGVL